MSTPEKKYEKIIKQLSETEPVLQHKEEFTSAIMSRIKQETPLRTKRPDVFILVIRPAMTIAAIFLAGLFIFQQYDYDYESINDGIPKEPSQKNIAEIQQFIAIDDKLSEELKSCINKTKSGAINMDRKCAARLIMLYKRIERQETKSHKQKLKNWFNH